MFSYSQAVEEQVVMSQAPVVEASAGALNLISEKSKKLRPEQQEQLQTKNDDLKNRYDDLSTRVKSRKQDLESNINHMRTEQDEQVGCTFQLLHFITRG